MIISWFTENYPPSKGGMSRSCDRIILNLREHCTVNVYHFTNKFKAFDTTAQVNGNYTAIPVFEDSSHTLNTLWAFIKDNPDVLKSDVLVAFGSHLCLKGIPLMSQWLKKPILSCFRGNDFDTALFSQKKQDLLYTIENANAIASVTKEKVDRIKLLNLNEHVYYTPNSIHLENWRVLNSDIKLSKQYKASLHLDEKTKVIGLIGFLKQKKGIDFFISCLKKSELYTNTHLRFVGDLEAHIETHLNTLNIPYSIVKPESQTELIANYLICNAVAIPSIYDGMPNVIFEAAALNIPVIASNAGGIPNVLSSENAFLFNVLNESSLLNALSEFQNSNTNQLENKTQNLRTLVENKFTPAQETKNYLDIFNTLKNNTHEI